MSRSRRRTPIIKGKPRRGVADWKRWSNKWARRTDLPDGGAFKRNGYTYNICDWVTNLYRKRTRDWYETLDDHQRAKFWAK